MSMLNTMIANTSKVSFIDYDPGDSRIVECKYAILDYPNDRQLLFIYGFMTNINEIGTVNLKLPKAPKVTSEIYLYKFGQFNPKYNLVFAPATTVQINIDSTLFGDGYFFGMYEI